MGIVLKGERQVEAGGVTFTVRPEKLGDYIHGREAALDQGLGVDGTLAPFGFSLLPRITAWSGVALADGTEAACTPENISELFEQQPGIMNELIRKVFFDEEAPASGNLESSADGSGESAPGSAEIAGTKPEGAE